MKECMASVWALIKAWAWPPAHMRKVNAALEDAQGLCDDSRAMIQGQAQIIQEQQAKINELELKLQMQAKRGNPRGEK